HARHDPPAPERVAVLPNRVARAGAAADVRERMRRQPVPGDRLQIVQVRRQARHLALQARYIDLVLIGLESRGLVNHAQAPIVPPGCRLRGRAPDVTEWSWCHRTLSSGYAWIARAV